MEKNPIELAASLNSMLKLIDFNVRLKITQNGDDLWTIETVNSTVTPFGPLSTSSTKTYLCGMMTILSALVLEGQGK